MSPASSLTDAIKTIDKSGAQIALIVQAEKLLGIVTDGDLRRALLRNMPLNSSVQNIMQRNFFYLPKSATDSEALELMQRKTLSQVPALDEQGRVVELFLLAELIQPKSLPNFVVIMAGGEGKRLLPLTQNCPKPMLKVTGKPLLEIILEQCIASGFRNFYFSVNYLREQIQDYFGDGLNHGVQIKYLEEDKPLGTAGSLSLITEKPSEPFLVLNGDVLTRVNFNQLLSYHNEHDAGATICVREYAGQIPYGVVKMNGNKIIGFQEKPVFKHLVNAGIYLLSPKLLELIPENDFFDMPQLLDLALQRGEHLSAFPIHEFWRDVGHLDSLEQAKKEWERF